MHSNASTARLSTIVTFAVWCGVFVVTGYHLALQFGIIWLEEPMGVWDTVYVAISKAWPHQYQWEHFVDGQDGYGPGYPLFVRPFILSGMDVYAAHRLANLFALVAACLLIAVILRRVGASNVITAAFTAIFYSLNAGSYSLQARPDFLVLFEILSIYAIGQPSVRDRMRTEAFSVVLGLLTLAAYFTKQYSCFAWACVIAHLLLSNGWAKAIRVGVVSALIVVYGILLYAQENPLYIMETMSAQITYSALSFSWFAHQVGDFAFLSFSIIAIAVSALSLRPIRLVLKREWPDLQLFVSSNRCYWALTALLGTTVLFLGIGWHSGAYLTYYFHLLLPQLVVVAGAYATALSRRVWVPLILIANFIALIVTAPDLPKLDNGWVALKKDILEQSGRVGVDNLMEPISRQAKNVEVFETGMSSFYMRVPFRIKSESPTVLAARQESEKYYLEQYNNLFVKNPIDVFYVECVESEVDGTRGLFPRHKAPYLLGKQMEKFRCAKIFYITPFYYATNNRRQTAGKTLTVVMKLVSIK